MLPKSWSKFSCLNNYLVTKQWFLIFFSQFFFLIFFLSQNMYTFSLSSFLCVFVCLFVCPSGPLQIYCFLRSNKVLVKSPSTCFGQTQILKYLILMIKIFFSVFLEAIKLPSHQLAQICLFFIFKFLYVGAPVRKGPPNGSHFCSAEYKTSIGWEN